MCSIHQCTHSGLCSCTGIGDLNCQDCKDISIRNLDEILGPMTDAFMLEKFPLPEPEVEPTKYYWVTVNPREGVPLATFMKAIEKMYRKKDILQFVYAYEIGDNGHNHCHGLILAHPKTRSDKFKKNLANSLDTKVNQICNTKVRNCFWIEEIINNKERAQQVLDYIYGTKTLLKLPAVEATKAWRALNNIQPFYGNPNELGLQQITIPDAPEDVMFPQNDDEETESLFDD